VVEREGAIEVIARAVETELNVFGESSGVSCWPVAVCREGVEPYMEVLAGVSECSGNSSTNH
jgi:hypothetical protein